MDVCSKAVLAAAGILGLVGCTGEAAPEEPPRFTMDQIPETVVATRSGLIGGVVDLAVDPAGSVYLLDAQADAVTVVDSTGAVLRRLGGSGAGPGELSGVESFALRGDSLVVVDAGNGRLQTFDLEGDPLHTRRLPSCAGGTVAPSPGPAGELVYPTLGFAPALAVVCSPDGDVRARIGDLLAPGQATVDMAEMHAEILEGRVPAMLLNAATVLTSDGGAVWLMVPAAARIERYDPSSGERLLRTTLDEPEFPEVHDAWIRRNEELEVPSVTALDYLLRMREVRGDLWVLVNTGRRKGAKLVVLSRSGEVRRRMLFPHVADAGDFAVDAEAGWIYFLVPGTAELVRASLGLAAWGRAH